MQYYPVSRMAAHQILPSAGWKSPPTVPAGWRPGVAGIWPLSTWLLASALSRAGLGGFAGAARAWSLWPTCSQ
eukprot:978266-Pyramimonas_sp.AAC.1